MWWHPLDAQFGTPWGLIWHPLGAWDGTPPRGCQIGAPLREGLDCDDRVAIALDGITSGARQRDVFRGVVPATRTGDDAVDVEGAPVWVNLPVPLPLAILADARERLDHLSA